MRGTVFALRAWYARRRTFLLAGCCVLFIGWVSPVRPGVVLGESMSPAFRNGQVFLASRVRGRPRVQPGDVVVVSVDGEYYLKRVYATGGETVWGLDSAEVDGVPDAVAGPEEVARMRQLAQRYEGVGRVVNMIVPPEHVFVLGDAEQHSYDSRNFGAVPVDAIRGKVVVARLFGLWRPESKSSAVVMAGEDKGRRR